MKNADKPKQALALNMSTLSEAECKMFNDHLNKRLGAKQKAIEFAGVAPSTYFAIMKGGSAKTSTIKKVATANAKVIKLFINKIA